MLRHRPLAKSGFTALVCLLIVSMAQAVVVERSGRSLKDTNSRFVRVLDAPQTVLRVTGGGGSLETRAVESTFQRKNAPATVFRAAEVAPERLDLTRTLLTELKARELPGQAIVIDLPADVLFDFDKSELRADAREPLERAAELLRSYPAAPVAIRGHTDGKGSDAYNDALSVRRAQAVAARLAAAGPSARPMDVEGRGKREPVAPNAQPDGSDDPEGRQRNRRVAIVILPSAKS